MIVWSRAGYGGSTPRPEPRGVDWHAPRGARGAAGLSLRRSASSAGARRHSDGGSIALIFAGAHPEVPRAVAVMAPHEFVEEETLAGIRIAREA